MWAYPSVERSFLSRYCIYHNRPRPSRCSLSPSSAPLDRSRHASPYMAFSTSSKQQEVPIASNQLIVSYRQLVTNHRTVPPTFLPCCIYPADSDAEPCRRRLPLLGQQHGRRLGAPLQEITLLEEDTLGQGSRAKASGNNEDVGMGIIVR